MAPAGKNEGYECTTSALEWTGLIFTIVSVNVSWWLFSLPLLFRHGFRLYIFSVTWESMRLYMPAFLALFALKAARTPEESPYIYYLGPLYVPQRRQELGPGMGPLSGVELQLDVRPLLGLSNFQFIKALAIDSLTVIATIINLVLDLRKGPRKIDTSQPATSSLWVYPTLPVAVIGLWLLLSARLRMREVWTVLGGFAVLLAIGTAITVPMAWISSNGGSNLVWVASMVGYLVLALPLVACNIQLWITALTLVTCFFRVGALGLTAAGEFSGHFQFIYFPFCQLRNTGFSLTYIFVGLSGAFLAGGAKIAYFRDMDLSGNFYDFRRSALIAAGLMAIPQEGLDPYQTPHPPSGPEIRLVLPLDSTPPDPPSGPETRQVLPLASTPSNPPSGTEVRQVPPLDSTPQTTTELSRITTLSSAQIAAAVNALGTRFDYGAPRPSAASTVPARASGGEATPTPPGPRYYYPR